MSLSLTRKLGKKADSDAAAPQEEAPKPKRAARAKLPASAPTPLEGFTLPSMDLLSYSNDPEKDRASEIELQDTAAHLQETLADFHIMADGCRVGSQAPRSRSSRSTFLRACV